MDTGSLDVLQYSADVDVLAIGYGIEVVFEGVLKELVDKDRSLW